MNEANSFKTCSHCQQDWPDMHQFILDQSLEVNGYQAAFGTLEEGLFLVTHKRENCGTTLSVVAGDLKALYHGPVYTESCAGTDVCEKLCLEKGKLEECCAPCMMAWVRVVLQYLRRHELPDGEEDAPPAVSPA